MHVLTHQSEFSTLTLWLHLSSAIEHATVWLQLLLNIYADPRFGEFNTYIGVLTTFIYSS